MAAAMAREEQERGGGVSEQIRRSLSGFADTALRVTSALPENQMAPAPLATVGGLDHVMEGRNQ
jgi:hypothetical protein